MGNDDGYDFAPDDNWLNADLYDRIKNEVDAWPDWKKQAFNVISRSEPKGGSHEHR